MKDKRLHQQYRNTANNRQIPFLRRLASLHEIVRNGYDGAIVKKRDEDHSLRWKGQTPGHIVMVIDFLRARSLRFP